MRSSFSSSFSCLLDAFLLLHTPVWEESHAGEVKQELAPPLRACSLAAVYYAIEMDMGLSIAPTRIHRTLHTRGGGPGAGVPTRASMKMAMSAEMSGPAPRLVVAIPEPAGRASARTIRDAPPTCLYRR